MVHLVFRSTLQIQKLIRVHRIINVILLRQYVVTSRYLTYKGMGPRRTYLPSQSNLLSNSLFWPLIESCVRNTDVVITREGCIINYQGSPVFSLYYFYLSFVNSSSILPTTTQVSCSSLHNRIPDCPVGSRAGQKACDWQCDWAGRLSRYGVRPNQTLL